MGPMAAHVQFSTEKPTDVAVKLLAYTEHNFMGGWGRHATITCTHIKKYHEIDLDEKKSAVTEI